MSDRLLHSYPKVYNLGHPELEHLLSDPVLVQEKVDGSQFSFGRIDGTLAMRSKGAEIYNEAKGGALVGSKDMFGKAIETVLGFAHLLPDQHIFRTEYLMKPKHNSIAYSRTPENFLALFDVETGNQRFLSPASVEDWATRLGLESVPTINGHEPIAHEPITADSLRSMLEQESFLGGAKIEGVVLKNYQRFGRDGKVLMGKHVSEAFKETHQREWKKVNPAGKDILDVLVERYRTEARWQKAVQHLREAGELTGTPRDIGPLIKEVRRDIREECEADMKKVLFGWAWGEIGRRVSAGAAEWYKGRLLETQFEEPAA